MIRPLVCLTLALIVILGIGMLAARAIGGTQPNPVVAWRTNPDGSSCGDSCLFGITPGVTSMDEAVKLIKAHPLSNEMKNQSSVSAPDNLNFTDNRSYSSILIRVNSSHLVQAISIQWNLETAPFFPHNRTSFGDFIVALGAPLYIYPALESDDWDQYYFRNGFSTGIYWITFGISDGEVHWAHDTPIQSLERFSECISVADRLTRERVRRAI